MYASIWKRQRDGTFKVVLDVGVPIPRAAAFSPGLERAAITNRFSGDYDDRTPPLAAADNVLNSALRASQARGYRGRLAPDARLHRPGVQPWVGEARILAWLAGQPRFRLGDGRYAESARSGDLGYTWGTYQLVRPAAAPAGGQPGRGGQAARGGGGLLRPRLDARAHRPVARGAGRAPASVRVPPEIWPYRDRSGTGVLE